jgi:predicted RNA-binding protein with PUA-like domain
VNRWLVKTEPAEFSFADLERAGRTVWDGVRNATALIHLRRFRRGDQVLVYHSGRERRVVGVARVVRGPYADPSLDEDRYVVVELEPVRGLERPVPLREIKSDPACADFDLVRVPRLSVLPVPDRLWQRLVAWPSVVTPASG